MAEEKKGHVKITIEVELNEALMAVIKEMPKHAMTWKKKE